MSLDDDSTSTELAAIVADLERRLDDLERASAETTQRRVEIEQALVET
jgi:hypothetical protein